MLYKKGDIIVANHSCRHIRKDKAYKVIDSLKNMSALEGVEGWYDNKRFRLTKNASILNVINSL